MKYDPVTGELGVYPNFEDTYSNYHGVVAWLYNPWTGVRRDPCDVEIPTAAGLLMYFP